MRHEVHQLQHLCLLSNARKLLTLAACIFQSPENLHGAVWPIVASLPIQTNGSVGLISQSTRSSFAVAFEMCLTFNSLHRSLNYRHVCVPTAAEGEKCDENRQLTLVTEGYSQSDCDAEPVWGKMHSILVLLRTIVK